MAGTSSNPSALCAQILADARLEAAEIIRRAEVQAAAQLAKASAEAKQIREELLAQARAGAARRREMLLATVAVETTRRQSNQVETQLEAIHEAIRQRLPAREFDVRQSLVALAAEAIRRMPGTDFILRLSPTDHAALDGLTEEIARHAGRSPLHLTALPDAAVSNGIRIQTADGFQHWDNRLESRLERLWPELRRQIAVQTRLGQSPTTGGAQ